MKKKLLFFMTTIMMFGFLQAQVFSAVTPSGHTLWYDIISSNTCVICRPNNSDYYSLSGSLIIPDSVMSNGIKYAVIGMHYYNAYNPTGGVFYNYNSHIQLTSVTFPNTMNSIAIYAFYGCNSLTNINFNSGLTAIDHHAFYGCTGITFISIPSSVTSVGAEAFCGCTSLSSLTLNANAPIANQEFQGCTSLTNVVVPNGVTSIGQSAFSGCTNLTSISIPNSVTSIGASAFYGCTSLHNLVLPNTLPSIMSSMCQGCSGLENVTIPNTVAYIQSNAFNGCDHLFNVTVPNSVLSIETNAFNGVWNVVYNGTATGSTWGALYVNAHLHDSILYNNSSKTSLLRAHWNIHSAIIPSTVTTIAAAAFCNCTNLSSLAIGSNIQTIGNNAFQGCTGLTTLNYNSSATSNGIFYGCTSLSNVTLGNNVIHIADQMFRDCYSLSTSPLTNNIQTIGQYAFENTNISTITIPHSCTSIGNYAFRYSPINTVTALLATPPTIGNNVFSYNPTITVPCGSGSAYRSSWSQYSSLITEPTVELALNVLAAEGGHAQATSTISCMDSTATISAVSDYGFHFDHWSDGNTDNPRIIHVTCDTTVTAFFARNSYTITLYSSNESMGSTTGGGTYLYGDTVVLMAIPTDHYHFMRWNYNYYGYTNENPITMVVSKDMELTANFAIDTYYVNVIPNEVTRGSVTGGGYFEYGSPMTVSATAYSGYQFVRWSNGAEYNPYTFAVTNDMTLEAVFMEEGTVYHVEATSDNSVMGTVTGGGPYATGETAVLTAVAYPGYHFVRWQDNVTDNPRTITVTQDVTFVAYFEANVGIEDISTSGFIVYAIDNMIHIDKAIGEKVTVYAIDGRVVASVQNATGQVSVPVSAAGVYVVKIDNHPARKVVVIR